MYFIGKVQKLQIWVQWDMGFSVPITNNFVTMNTVKKIQELIKQGIAPPLYKKESAKIELRNTHSLVTLSLNVSIKMFSISTVLFGGHCKGLASSISSGTISVQIAETNISLFCTYYHFPVLLLFVIVWSPGGSVKYKSRGAFHTWHLWQIPCTGWIGYFQLRFFLPLSVYT